MEKISGGPDAAQRRSFGDADPNVRASRQAKHVDVHDIRSWSGSARHGASSTTFDGCALPRDHDGDVGRP